MIALKNGLALLDEVIQQIESSARSYAAKPGANEAYLKLQNEILKKLISVYNSFELNTDVFLKFYDYWKKIEKEMNRLENIDDQITGHVIKICTKPGCNENYSLIRINPFNNN